MGEIEMGEKEAEDVLVFVNGSRLWRAINLRAGFR